MSDIHPFVESLYGHAARENRAALADLRRSLTHPLAAMPYIVPYLRRDASHREERTLTLVGALFALHPRAGSRTLASALSLLSDQNDSIALRFRALLDANDEDLHVHLRHAVSLARSNDIPIDFNDLLRTLRGWNHPDRWAQRSWARDFWGSRTARAGSHDASDNEKE